MKKKIIFLFTGNARTSHLNIDISKRRSEIMESYNRYIFTDEFKTLYDYKIYISTDDIHLHDTFQYFSKDKIGNIHLFVDYYLKPVHNKIKHIDDYLNSYNDQNWSYYQKYDNSIHQHYKILDCYNLLRNDAHELETCDYIVRIRFDVVITKSFVEIMQSFVSNPNLKLVINWDFIGIGTKDMMQCYCTGLENKYGKYLKNNFVINFNQDLNNFSFEHDLRRWMYAPERQLFEMLFEYCQQHHLDINKTIQSDENKCQGNPFKKKMK
jgi:hypothetical protein